MSVSPHIVLVNPTIAKPRHARFPLAVLSLSSALQPTRTSTIVDGNVDRSYIPNALRAIEAHDTRAVGVSVMGGPQLVSAIALSKAVRERFPSLPIVWGGHFPTSIPEGALRAPYVDFVVRAQGEQTFKELLDALDGGADPVALEPIKGLSWRAADGTPRHNALRPFSPASLASEPAYDRLGDLRRYMTPTYLGRRTAAYQAALGCRFRCTFCGVATMFRGRMALPTAERLEQDLLFLKQQAGADALQFYDHNFFDREVDMVPLLEVLARVQLPWWCFARSDALVNLSERSWALVRKSRLRMAYIGAESPSDWLLHDIRKGTRSDQTLEAVEVCRRNGVIPELSFMLAPPHDPEGETEKTFEFIRLIKRRYPPTEIMLYVYTPLPAVPGSGKAAPRSGAQLLDTAGNPVLFPETADDWARPEWVSYWCHGDAPWVTPRLQQRIRDFTTVLGCRFPTITDIRSPPWGKWMLQGLASWRYRYARYDRPWELNFSRKFVRLWDPRVSSL